MKRRLPSPRPPAAPRSSKEPKKTRIAVHLPCKPRPYRPGHGPPLQRLRLLPPHDSTAYIIERILLPSPGLSASGKPLPKRISYVIGWTDLPAARILVPAMQILDYVSPRVFEEWESNAETYLEEMRAKLLLLESRAPPAASRSRKRPSPTVPASASEAGDFKHRARREAAALDSNNSTSSSWEETDSHDLAISEDYHSASLAGSKPDLAWEHVTSAQDEAARLQDEMELDFLLNSALFDGQTDISTDEHGSLKPSPANKSPARESLSSVSPAVTMSLPPTFPVGYGPLDPQRAEPSAAAALLHTHSPRTFDPSSLQRGFSPASLNPDDEDHNARASLGQPVPSPPPPPPPLPHSPQQPLPRQQQVAPVESDGAASEKEAVSAAKQSPSAESGVADEDQDDVVWEVERLEDVGIYKVDGRGHVRYFKVRWAGEWPPDQKATWEPEENIPPTMVRDFLKRKNRRAPKRKSAARAKQMKLAWQARKMAKREEVGDGLESAQKDAVGKDEEEEAAGGRDNNEASSTKSPEDVRREKSELSRVGSSRHSSATFTAEEHGQAEALTVGNADLSGAESVSQ